MYSVKIILLKAMSSQELVEDGTLLIQLNFKFRLFIFMQSYYCENG